MRLTINKDYFIKALLASSKATASKSPQPILLNLKLVLSEKGLEIIGSNGEISIKSLVPYMIGEETIIKDARNGSCLLNAHILCEAVRKLEGNELSFEVIDDSIVKIDDGRSSFKLNSIKVEEYPDIDLNTEESTCLNLSSKAFGELVDKTAFAVATKNQHMALICIHFEAKEGKLIATSTDSARLSRAEMLINEDVNFATNIPGKTLLDIVHLFETESSLRMSVTPRKVIFEYQNLVISCSVVASDYPNIASVIPQNFNYYLEINARELVNAIDRARVVSSDAEPVVKLSMKDESVEITARSDNSGSSLEKIETFKFNGDRLEISFNSQFVIDAIRAVGGEDVTFAFVAETKPFAVKNPKDESIVEIITPMRTAI